MARTSRLKNFDYIGRFRYFVTACTYLRRPVFRDADTVRLVTEQILRSALARDFEVLAYCFMPDHVHLLVMGTQLNSEFTSFMTLAKQTSGYFYSKAAGARLWQGNYHDRVLRNSEATPAAIAYMLANPIDAGLATCIGDYPFWGSGKYSREELLTMVSEAWQT